MKKARGVHFILSSTEGITFTKRALLVNEIRRAVYLLILSFSPMLYMGGTAYGVFETLSVAVTTYVIMWFFMWINGFIDMPGMTFAFALFAMYAAVAADLVIVYFGIPLWILTPLVICLMMLQLKIGEKKLRRVYDDK